MTRRAPVAYEQFISELAAGLRCRHQIEDLRFGSKNRLRGRSKVQHQIDVSFVEVTDQSRKLVLIECKSLQTGRRVNLGHLKVLKATADDLSGWSSLVSQVEGHIVSSVPLQAGAAQYAGFYGIRSHVVSDGPDWVFQYGRVVQIGLAIVAAEATISGSAAISRRCDRCREHFQPLDTERECPTCVVQQQGAA